MYALYETKNFISFQLDFRNLLPIYTISDVLAVTTKMCQFPSFLSFSLLGPHLIDETKFTITFLDNETIEVRWAVYPNVTSYDLNLTLTYYVNSVGDCQPIEAPESFNEYVPAILPIYCFNTKGSMWILFSLAFQGCLSFLLFSFLLCSFLSFLFFNLYILCLLIF